MVNIEELGRILTVLAQVRALLVEFPGEPTLVAIRTDLLAQAKATHTP